MLSHKNFLAGGKKCVFSYLVCNIMIKIIKVMRTLDGILGIE